MDGESLATLLQRQPGLGLVARTWHCWGGVGAGEGRGAGAGAEMGAGTGAGTGAGAGARAGQSGCLGPQSRARLGGRGPPPWSPWGCLSWGLLPSYPPAWGPDRSLSPPAPWPSPQQRGPLAVGCHSALGWGPASVSPLLGDPGFPLTSPEPPGSTSKNGARHPWCAGQMGEDSGRGRPCGALGEPPHLPVGPGGQDPDPLDLPA